MSLSCRCCCPSFRCRNEKKGCTTVHTFTPRMKIASDASNAPRLETFHPRTVHIFSRVLEMNELQTTTDASAFASVAQLPRREAFHFGPTFPGVTSALKRRRTPGYSPTTPAGWYSQPRTVHIFSRGSRRELPLSSAPFTGLRSRRESAECNPRLQPGDEECRSRQASRRGRRASAAT